MRTVGKRKILMYALAIALCITSVAYAILQTTLNITGTVTKKGGSWSIYFNNVANVTNVGSATMETPSLTNTTLLTFNSKLQKPQDSSSFTVDVVNDGSLNARLSSIVLTGADIAKENDITYTVTYLDGTEIKENDTLASKETKTLKVVVKYDDVNSVSATSVNLDFGLTLIYVQDDGTSSGGSTPQEPTIDLTQFYTYTLNDAGNGYKLGLVDEFHRSAEGVCGTVDMCEVQDIDDPGCVGQTETIYQSDYIVNGSTLWKVGDPLPNPGSTYNGKPVVDMSYLFRGSNECYDRLGNYSLDFSLWDTSNVTNMSYMFTRYPSESLDISSFDMSNVTITEPMFRLPISGTTVYVATEADKTKIKSADETGLDVKVDLTPFYTYTLNDEGTGYKVSLSSDFANVLNGVTTPTGNPDGVLEYQSIKDYVVNGITLWVANGPLPNPGATYNGKPVVDMSNMFSEVDGSWVISDFATLDLSNWDFTNVTKFDGIFDDYIYITIIVPNEDVKTKLEEVHANSDCPKEWTIEVKGSN